VPTVTTTPTVAPSCSVPPELKFQGDPIITPISGSYTVSNGQWEDIPNCANTFTYKWQYTTSDLFFGPIPEDSWYDYTGLTSNSTTYDYLYNTVEVDCATYARALVTATNESGLTVTMSAGPLIEMCS
jgi:hypothetical protein